MAGKFILTVKSAEDKVIVYNNKPCIYEHKSFEDLMAHVKRFRATGVMSSYGWKLEISQ